MGIITCMMGIGFGNCDNVRVNGGEFERGLGFREGVGVGGSQRIM